MERLTIKQIAALSKVSPTTVSFVLNGNGSVSDATRRRVLGIIEATHYVPSAASQQLSSKRSGNIALIYPAGASPFVDLFYCEVTEGLTAALTQAGYRAVFCPFQAGSLTEIPEIIRREDADGAIFFQDAGRSVLDSLDAMHFPFLVLDSSEASYPYASVTVDYESFMLTEVDYLVKKGHTQIAFWGRDTLPSYYMRCFSGYQKAIAVHHLPIEAHWVQHYNGSDTQAIDRMEQLWQYPERRPTALCCSSDLSAISAIHAAKTLGIRVPEDLSVIAMDDISISRYISPPLTTVRCKKKTMGKSAAALLLRIIQGKQPAAIRVQAADVRERSTVCQMLPES